MAVLSIYKCLLILGFNIIQSLHWLHVGIAWKTFENFNAQTTPKSIKSVSLVLCISTF